MIKALVLVGVIALSGCATRTLPVASLPYYTMDNFKAECSLSATQRKFLEDRVAEYELYHQTRPYTEQDKQYYIKLKNSLWGLRSACGANRQS
jgi:hypothetical protein